MNPIRTALAILLLFVVFSGARQAFAQSEPVRVGVGFDAVIQSKDGLGVGFRTRWSRPINWDVSLALDLGLSGFIFQGREKASYVFDPLVSVIVTFPDVSRATYLLGGFGIYAPFGPGDHLDGGPLLHLGIGRALPLRESTMYYELDPAIIVLKNSIGLSLPFRIGIIL